MGVCRAGSRASTRECEDGGLQGRIQGVVKLVREDKLFSRAQYLLGICTREP